MVAPESARCGGGGGARADRVGAASPTFIDTLKPLLAALLIAWARPAAALPADGVVVGGSGAISQSASTLTVTQATPRLALNWQGFNIGATETVNFVQPNRSAVALNRVLGAEASAIYGRLSANGQVFLANSNGILFGRGAQVNVSGLVASTLDLSAADFMSGKRTFTGNGGRIDNLGSLTASDGGYIALLGGQVSNQGTISAQLGTVALAAGSRVSLDFAGDRLLNLQVEQGTLDGLVENGQLIAADGGQVILTTRAAGELLSGVVNNTGIVQARGISTDNGVIRLTGDLVVNTGTLDASGSNGGSIALGGRSLLQAGAVRADGHGASGSGGSIALAASGALIQTAAGEISANANGQAGSIALSGGSAVFLSGSVSASGESGGRITATAPNLTLAAATISADGTANGGTLLIGGDAHGDNSSIANAQTTIVNPSTTLSAHGKQGRIVVWSDQETSYYGSARTGAEGFIEVSGKASLSYGGKTDAGAGGHVLLDPTNLIIDASAPTLFYIDLANPDPAASEQHGSGGVIALANGNIVIGSPKDNFGGASAGAVYLYSGSSGALISALTGSTANDQVGNGGMTALTGNGNFVVTSYKWNNGTATLAGAATWGSGTAGVSGIVSSANSLVGSTANDQVGNYGITALTNGSYVVRIPNWYNGTIANAGAATWGSGTAGVSGAVSSVNSLVGGKTSDGVGNTVTALINGNYVVSSSSWDNGTIANAGAATWGSGTAGISGAISSANSLVGGKASDGVSSGGVTALTNGNYVVSSYSWDNGAIVDAGAATWGNGTSGIAGLVSSTNSLVGSKAIDGLGNGGVTALTNGNYVVGSPNWDNGTIVDAGAVTWGNGLGGTVGAVSSTNSLVGGKASDGVSGGGVTALTNGNYVVRSAAWDNGTIVDAGAATWGNGTSGVVGAITSTNSLVGGKASDGVSSGGVTALTNGNYVVGSSSWDNGAIVNAGAASWGNGTSGIAGLVSSTNSLVGGKASDGVGSSVKALTNGNYVVSSANWDNGTIVDAGAATWGNGTSGIAGLVSSTNSLVGGKAGDGVGSSVKALTNGNYVVSSNNWDNGTIVNAGAVTWGNGASGIAGLVSSANSLIGALNEYLGSGVTALVNGSYVVDNYSWDNGTIVNAGAATWGSGTAGVSGAISSVNSLVGSTAHDRVGDMSVWALTNGNYVVRSSDWDSGTIVDAGAVTWGSGATGISGFITSVNSLLGAQANDRLGMGAGVVLTLANSNYVVRSPNWDQGALANAGAVWLVADPSNLATMVNNSLGNTTLSPAALAGAAIAGSTVTLQASQNITVNSAVSVAGHLNLVAGNDLTLNAGIASSATGDALQLAGLRFINNVGAGALSAPSGRWLVWSATPANDTRGGLAYDFKQYGATYGSSSAAQVSGNGFLHTAAPQITASLTGSVSKVYDATTAATLLAANYSKSGALDGDSVTLTMPTSGAYDTRNAAASGKDVAVTGVGIAGATNGAATVYGYQLAATSINGAVGAITPKALSVSGIGASDKVYDTTIVATLTGTGSVVALVGDTVSVIGSGSGAFTDKNVGTAKSVTVSGFGLSGADAGNYSVVQPAGVTADITVASLAVTGIAASNKVYDTTTAATLSGTAAVTALGSDTVTVSGPGSGVFANKNVGNAKAVTVSGFSLAGADAGNYTVAQPAGVTASITAASLAVTGIAASNKVYDTTTAATLAGTAVVSALGSDTVSVSGAGNGAFADKNVGTAKSVTVSGYTLGGADAGNYSVTQPVGVSANITAASLAVSGISASDKVYDSTTAATLSGAAVVTALGSDTLTVSGPGSGVFANKNVGTAKSVAVSGYTLGGADAGNYIVTQPVGVMANITAASLAVNGITASDKIYDATTAATLSGTAVVAALGSDVVTVGGAGSGVFADKNASTANSVAVSGYALGGTDAGNYSIVQPAGLVAAITPKALTMSGLSVAASKVYDATTTALVGGTGALAASEAPGAGTGTDGKAYGGDAVSLGGTATGTYDSKDVATASTVSYGGLSLSGAQARNYSLVIQGPSPAAISARPLKVSYGGVNKAYDGSIAATVTAADDRLGSDPLVILRNAVFVDPYVGTGKPVNVSGASLSGAAAGNYALLSTSGTTSADITGFPLPPLPPALFAAAISFASELSSLSELPGCGGTAATGIGDCGTSGKAQSTFNALVVESRGIRLPDDVMSTLR